MDTGMCGSLDIRGKGAGQASHGLFHIEPHKTEAQLCSLGGTCHYPERQVGGGEMDYFLPVPEIQISAQCQSALPWCFYWA